ncbi:Phosphopantetheine adenylyltransferase [hydrothermal vent metagenome]|uniref:Phosphopantetheine adenylyltransferase n=1 Tax=hydrothermal vent metagenome TaxID=652676 RepID=A0A3B0T6S4_9ZZZZ
MARIALYPGSFDPLTLGHIDIARRAFALADTLVVAIGTHHGKTPVLDAATRATLIETEIGALAASAGAKVKVMTFDGLVVDAARTAGATLLVRGVRNVTDFDYEMRMSQMNRALEARIETVFLAAGSDVGFISSTLVRQISAMGGDVSAFVPEAVQNALIRVRS